MAYDIRRDANKHLTADQFWIFDSGIGGQQAVLYFAHESKLLQGNHVPIDGIVPKTNFFFKHFLLPSKSGKTVEGKARAKFEHRQAGRETYRKFNTAKAAGKEWTGFRNEDDEFVPYPVKEGLKREHAGLNWQEKYGGSLQGGDAKSDVIVLAKHDEDEKDWEDEQLGAVLPISREQAALKFFNALHQAWLGREQVEKRLPKLEVIIDFGRTCVLRMPSNAARERMKIQAIAHSEFFFDIQQPQTPKARSDESSLEYLSLCNEVQSGGREGRS
jgi:hypothetical protein